MKIKDLENQIIEASKAYYYTDSPLMSDEEFDRLVARLKEIDPNNRVLSTPNWNAKVKERHLTERPHRFFVTGLPKTKFVDYDLDQLNGHLLTVKLDGISAVAYYTNGKLDYVLSRNTGESGFDITEKLRYCNIPKTVDPRLTWVRGEIVAKVGTAEKNGYANERNMVAGLTNSIELTNAHADLEFIAYDCNLGKTLEQLQELNQNSGFYIVRAFTVSSREEYLNIEHLFDYTKFEGINYPYLSDGLVVTDKDGNSIALKYPNKSYFVKVTGIVNQVSERGRVIPVIQIEPTNINGTTITYCTGFNYQAIKIAQIGVGAVIEITKANEVIPHWTGTIQKGEYIEPTEIDGKPTHWNGVHLEVGVNKVRNTITRLIEQKVPKGFASAKINQLIDNFNLVNFESLARILCDDFTKEYEVKLRDEFGTFFNHYLEFINTAKQGWTLSELLVASLSEGLGNTAATMIQEQYGSSRDMLITDLQSLRSLPDTISVPTITTRKGIEQNLDLILSLLLSPLPHKIAEQIRRDDLLGICLTGKLSQPRPKLLDEWKEYAVEVDITKANYLITDNPNSGSSKNKKAQKLNIPVITEQEFREILKGLNQ